MSKTMRQGAGNIYIYGAQLLRALDDRTLFLLVQCAIAWAVLIFPNQGAALQLSQWGVSPTLYALASGIVSILALVWPRSGWYVGSVLVFLCYLGALTNYVGVTGTTYSVLFAYGGYWLYGVKALRE